MIPVIIFHVLPFWNTQTRIIVTAIWALFIIIDTVDIMVKMKRDEREKIHEAIAERNALWGITIVLTLGIAWQATKSAITKSLQIDWFIVAAIIIGLIIKCASNIYIDKKN